MSNYCDDCGRLKNIGCNCGVEFKDKIKSIHNQWATWSDTRK